MKEKLAKVTLINDGGYDFMHNVNFPVEVMAKPWNAKGSIAKGHDGYDVSANELVRVGYDEDQIRLESSDCFYFSVGAGEVSAIIEANKP